MSNRILYIEDNLSNRNLVRRILESEGFDVHDTDNAIDGIAMAGRIAPDLILMDLSMPELDGLTATLQLRSMPNMDRVPIIALTAHAMKGDQERALEICDGYIAKPIDVDSFPGQVRHFMRSRT